MNKLLKGTSILLASIFLLSGCGGNEETEGYKEIRNLTYDGTFVSWSKVKDAKSYNISINNGAVQSVPASSGTVSYRYNCGGENFTFNIEAVVKEGSSDNPSYNMTFEKLGDLNDLHVEDGKLTWTLVDEADAYLVVINNSTAQQVTMNEIALPVGKFSVKAKATRISNIVNGNNPYFSDWSKTINGTLLEAPKNISYDSEVFKWNPVTGALKYLVDLDGQQFETTTASFARAGDQTNFTFKVKAVGNGVTTYDSAFSESKTYTYIPTITDIQVVDGVVVWTAPDHCAGYQLKVNGIVQQKTLTTPEYAGCYAGQSTRLQILPIGDTDFYYSTWSREIVVNLLATPSIKYQNTGVTWNAIQNAIGYTVRVEKDGKIVKEESLGADTLVYNYTYPEVGEYKVTVKANAINNEASWWDSKFSSPVSVRRLDTPKGMKLTNNPLVANQVNVVTNAVTGASQYKLYANGVNIATSDTPNFNVSVADINDSLTEVEVLLEVEAIGNTSSTSQVLLNSLEKSAINATKLATPTNVVVNNGKLTWDSVNKATNYIVTIDGVKTVVTSREHIFTNLSAGPHTVYVQAMGDGENIIASSLSPKLTVTKLATPVTSINYDNASGRYALVWDVIEGATSYRVIQGTQTFTANTNSFDISGQSHLFIAGQANQITVQALGDGERILDGDVSSTKTVYKFETPNNPQISGDNLVWNQSSNGSKNASQYELKIDGEPVIVNGTSYSLSNFEPGQHNVSIKALGDHVSTIDSESSGAGFTFTKLAKVSNIIQDGSTLKWDPVESAEKYYVSLGTQLNRVEVKETCFDLKQYVEGSGQYNVIITAVGNGYNVANSNDETYKFVCYNLNQPTLANSYEEIQDYQFSVEKLPTQNVLQINVKNYKGIDGVKVVVKVGGIPQNVIEENGYSYVNYPMSNTVPGTQYDVTVQYEFSGFVDGNYYVNSLPSNVYTYVV